MNMAPARIRNMIFGSKCDALFHVCLIPVWPKIKMAARTIETANNNRLKAYQKNEAISRLNTVSGVSRQAKKGGYM